MVTVKKIKNKRDSPNIPLQKKFNASLYYLAS